MVELIDKISTMQIVLIQMILITITLMFVFGKFVKSILLIIKKLDD